MLSFDALSEDWHGPPLIGLSEMYSLSSGKSLIRRSVRFSWEWAAQSDVLFVTNDHVLPPVVVLFCYHDTL